MEEIIKLLELNNTNDHGTHIKIECKVAFEPTGVIESFGAYWIIELTRIPFYWKSNNRYELGKEGLSMKIYSLYFDHLVKETIEFLKWYKENKQCI